MTNNSSLSKDPNWSTYGLGQYQRKSLSEVGEYKEDEAKDNELFHRDPHREKKAWWKTNFLLQENVLFGTWDGVFASCMINIFGVVIFLRTGWMVGFAGLLLALWIIVMTTVIALIAMLSAIGVCERCQIESGGVHFLLSHVLGSRIASSIGFLYCFGQAVASSLYASGFGESISSLIKNEDPWIPKLIAVAALIFLLGVNLTGAKWVIRLQILLLLIIFVAVLDFFVGSFVKRTPSLGVIGYSLGTFQNNTYPRFNKENSFFSVFGVFFPTATGVCAGINMSGELRNPRESIPTGTLLAIFVSFVLYACFAIVLAGTCTPYALQHDTMITEKVALHGPVLLTGLYISSLSAALGGMSTAPRLLRVIAETTKLPGTGFLAKHYGKNQVPVFSIIVIVTISISFVFAGDLNVLGPIVTIPFLMTYGTLSYAYFVLAKSFDIRRRRENLYKTFIHSKHSKSTEISKLNGISTADGNKIDPDNSVNTKSPENGSRDKECILCEQSHELDRLFPERMSYGSTDDNIFGKYCPQAHNEIIKQPKSLYSIFINRWISLFGTILFTSLMFAVEWRYSLAGIGVWFILYIYIGLASPGLFSGVAEFSYLSCVTDSPYATRSKETKGESEILIATKTPFITTESLHVTDQSSDYQSRDRYHQTQEFNNYGLVNAFTRPSTGQG